MKQPRLLIVGDSITLGVAEASGQEVVRRVQKTYVAHLAGLMPGLAIAADGALHRTTSEARVELPTLLARHRPDAVLLMLGGNDVELDWKRFVLSDGKVIRHRVAVERYVENLQEMARMVSAAGAVPAVTDFPRARALDRARYIARVAGREIWPMIERGGGEAEWDRRVAMYARAALDMAARAGVAGAWYAAALELSGGGFGEDGAHPDDAGHAVIAEALAPPLSSLLMRPRSAAVPVTPLALERTA